MPVEYWFKLEAHYRGTRARLVEEAGPENTRPAKMPARQRQKAEMSHKKALLNDARQAHNRNIVDIPD